MPSLTDINFKINIPPSKGILKIDPSFGKSLETDFTFSVDGVVDID